jgi:pSer/pThr/pTyr-binding forkhead associated (FHA) protein
MIQLRILSGKQAGTDWLACRFPVRIGREPSAELQLEDPGVWEQHLEIRLQPAQGFLLRSRPDALAAVNGRPTGQTLLRNGDLIEIGSLKLQFWLSEARQSGLALGEVLTWLGLAAVALTQVGLICWLLR